MTTKGSMLNSLRFATEQTENMSDSTNDDLILETTVCMVDTANDGMSSYLELVAFAFLDTVNNVISVFLAHVL